MGKTNKLHRSLDEKQHHVSKAVKKEHMDRSVKDIDRLLRNKRYEWFFDDTSREEEHLHEQG
jgi:hypothetical protein